MANKILTINIDDPMEEDVDDLKLSLKKLSATDIENIEQLGNEFESLLSTVEALRLMTLAVTKSRSILVQGPVGCGKSFLIQYLAERHGKSRIPDFVTVQLGEHMDGKALLGTYQCAEIPGEFTWIPGPLTKALCEGRWLLLEDLNCAPIDALSSLVSVLECRTVHLPGRGIINAHPNFRLFATLRTENGAIRDDRQFIYNQNWVHITLNQFGDEEASKIICRRHHGLTPIVGRLLDAFRTSLSPVHDRRCRNVSFRDVLKVCNRINGKEGDPVAIFRDASDCLSSHIRKADDRLESLLSLAEKLNINKEKAQYYFQIYKPTVQIERNLLVVGRVSLERHKSTQHFRNECLALTRPTCNLLEKLAVCVYMTEPVLLVGETGCGKTAAIQFLARQTGSKLHVVNMSQQSENSDLTGGFKPTDTKHLAKSLKERYVDLFSRTFAVAQNEKFLCHVQACYTSNRWLELTQLMRHTGKKGVQNNDQLLRSEWFSLLEEITKLERVMKHCGEGLSFSFMEGVLTKSMKNGDWILLDEINLASPEAIDCLYTLLDGQSRNIVAFDQQNSLEPLRIHPNFRLFACMNPSGDVGKKELPTGIRNRFTEIFVSEPDSIEDLREIVRSYLNELSVEPKLIESLVELYLALKSPESNAVNWPCYSLRTLCRALAYGRTNPYSNVVRSLYEAFCMSFLTELDSILYGKVEALIKEFIIGKDQKMVARFLKQPLPPPIAAGEYVNVQGYWLKRGRMGELSDERYLLTTTVERNLRDLARAVAARNYSILLQGETSVGKTSLIMHLAKLTGNKCVRINNHEHTDIQEYVGTYATDENNKLTFVEGPLIKAMRNGDWIILDELNLSPPDILEALNRLLDDNRELFVAETQETIRAHPDFILFATQNPAGIYGGRKTLSRAFRYRFIELRFNELPFGELEKILQHRCSLPLSYAKKMVKVMRDLQMYRSKSGVFVGRESYMTLRDLFRWGERYRLASNVKNRLEDWDQYLADQGYLLLGCRARRDEDETVIRDVLKIHFSRAVEPEKLFAIASPYFLFDLSQAIKGFDHLVWTLEARRLAVLIGQALKYNEPLLLVGETGCGKTTLCQMFAEMQKKSLKVINCHMMTEAADFLGRLAPASPEKRETGGLFEWRDGLLVHAMRSGCPLLIDEISLADDSVLERLNSVLEPERTLLLAEKGSSDEGSNEMVSAIDGFALMATMNPGGDYGKKELSRALRNRFTEIWCRNLFNADDFVAIVEHNIGKGLSMGEGESGFGQAMLRFVAWFTQNCPVEFMRCISLRDIMDWVKFINRCSNETMAPWLAYLHGAMVVFIDGLGGNKSSIDRSVVDLFRQLCMDLLIRQVAIYGHGTSKHELINGKGALVSTEAHWGLDPFFIGSGGGKQKIDPRYSFETPGCRKNLFRLLRAMQLEKPVLLEGSPGVGKTSLVSALAKATGHRLTRINLSEQTDLSDLFGCDLPVVSPDGQQTFDWVDGSFLSALKEGHWILIDEMNLASQSVLEGLNACFDHRGEIYVPEIDRSFKVDQRNTRFFACQNPYSQGGNRKGLPKSFLNRFSIVLVEALCIEDQETILANLFSNIDINILKKMIQLNEEVNDAVSINRLWGQSGSPWEFNLRDLMRWCELTVEENRNSAAFADLVYANRFRSTEDRHQFWSIFDKIFGSEAFFESSLQFNITAPILQVGDAILTRNKDGLSKMDETNNIELCRSMLKPLRALIHCVNRRNLAILVGHSAIGKTCLVKTLATLAGRRLRTVYLTSDSDSSELLGSFEQTVDDSDVKKIKHDLRNSCRGHKRALALVRNFDGNSEIFDQIEISLKESKASEDTLNNVRKLKTDWLEQTRTGKKLRFSWIDSPLVEALKNGDWILLENVNYCSPAVLDRLNALLEPDGELIVTERGFVDGKIPTYRPHEDFRIFYAMDPSHGSISRSMRNRGIEICLLEEESWSRDPLDIVHVLTTETGDYSVSRQLADQFLDKNEDHRFRIRNLLQNAFAASKDGDDGLESEENIIGALENEEFQGHVSIHWIKRDAQSVRVIRDAAYLIQMTRQGVGNWQRISVALKQFLLRTTGSDVSLQKTVVKWIQRILSDTHFTKMLSKWGKDNDYEFRWNLELAQFLMKTKNLPMPNEEILNKHFLYSNASWILNENIAISKSGSLYELAKDIKEDDIRDDVPREIVFIGALFKTLFKFLENIFKDDSCLIQFDDKLIAFITRLQTFARICCMNRIDLNMDADIIRLYWIWFAAIMEKFLENIRIESKSDLLQVCQSLNRIWSTDRIDWKIYTSVRHHLTGTDYVLQSEVEATMKSFLIRSIFLLNDVLTKSIIQDREIIERECHQLEKEVFEILTSIDQPNMELVERRLEQLNCELYDDGGDTSVFSRRDILMRKLSIIDHLQIDDSNGCTVVENQSLLPFHALFKNNTIAEKRRPLPLLLEFLKHFLMPIREDGLTSRFGGIESIGVKGCHLAMIPLETSVVTEFLNQNIKSGSIQVAISHVPRFLLEINKFSVYFWRMGVFAGGLEKRLKKTVSPLIASVCTDLREATTPFGDAKNISDHYKVLQQFEINENDESMRFYEKCADLGIALCSLSTPPANCIDPVVKERTKIEWLREQLQFVQTELECLNGQYELLTGRPLISNGRIMLEFTHPYVQALLEMKTNIEKKLIMAGDDRKLYRPRISQFETIGRKFREFVEITRENFIGFRSGINQCHDLKENDQKVLLARMQNWLRSCEWFQKDVDKLHAAYTDVTLPFSVGLYLLQFVISQWSIIVWTINVKKTSQITPGVNEKILNITKTLFLLSPTSISSNDLAFLPLKDSLSFASCAFQEIHDRKSKENLLLNAFNRLLDVWIERENEKRSKREESSYEYKPKAPLEVEEQEKLETITLFPMPPSDDDDNEIEPIPMERKEDGDDLWFGRQAQNLLNRFESTSSEFIKFWSMYESYLNIGKEYPMILSEAEEATSLPAHLLALNHVSRWLSGKEGDQKSKKTINVYKDWDVEESGKFQKLVMTLIEGAKKLMIEWPDNEALGLIRDRGYAALNSPATSVIMALAVTLEKLISDAEQWEKVAARHVKLEHCLQPLRSLLLDWRKMELTSWERLLDDAELEFQEKGAVSVLQFGLVWKTWLAGHLSDDDILKACSQLLETSSVGEFGNRVQLTNSFIDLCSSIGIVDKSKEAILLKIRNVLRYYLQYKKTIWNNARKQREPVEKELKDFIKIAKFQDLNIWTIKKSSADAHGKLFRLVKQYKEILSAGVLSQIDILPMPSFDVSPSIISTIDHHTLSLPNMDLSLYSSLEVLSKASSYFDRLSTLNAELLTKYGKDEKSILAALTNTREDAEETAVFLSQPVPYKGTDEEKTKLFKRTLQMRQKTMANFFISLREMGFSFRKGANLEEKQLNDACFTMEFLNREADDDANWTNIYRMVENNFWSLISRKTQFDEVRRKPHEQIETQTGMRCFGFTQHFTWLLVEIEKKILAGSKSIQEFTSVCKTLTELKSDFERRGDLVDQIKGKQLLTSLNDCLTEICRNVENTKRIWQCCPDEKKMQMWNIPEKVVMAAPNLCSWTSTSEEYLEVMAALEKVKSVVMEADKEFRMVQKEVVNGNDFILWSHFDSMQKISEALLSISDPIDQLLKSSTSTTDNEQKENFLNSALLNAQRNLIDFSIVRDFMKIDGEKSISTSSEDVHGIYTTADSMVKKILLATQTSFQNSVKAGDGARDSSTFENLQQLISSIAPEKIDEMKKMVIDFLVNVTKCRGIDHLSGLVAIVDAFVQRYMQAVDVQYRGLLSSASSFHNLYAVIVDCWTKIMKCGYLEPVPIMEKGDGSGDQSQFKDIENGGLGEGEGLNDVSDQITDVGQIEGLKNETQTAEEDKSEKMKDVEKPIDMDDDFEAPMEDIQQEEEQSDKDDQEGEDEQPEMEWKAGEAEEPQEEQLDPGLWEPPKDEKDQSQLDDGTKGADKLDDQLAAKDDRLFDDRGPEFDEKNANEESQEQDENGEEKDEEEFDLENVNLDNQLDDDGSDGDNRDEKNDSDVEGDIEDETIGPDEILEDLENEEMENENRDDLKNATAEKTFSSSGVNNQAKQNGEIGDEKNNEVDQEKRQDVETDDLNEKDNEPESGQANQKDEKSTKADHPSGESVKKKQTREKISKRSAEKSDQSAIKRQRLTDDQKTMGTSEEATIKEAEIEQAEQQSDDGMDSEMPDESDNVFSHRPDVGAEGMQIIDSASVETALKQSSDTRRALMMAEEEKNKKEEITKEKEASSKDADSTRNQQESISDKSEEQTDKSMEDNLELANRETTSTIHTVMDFYTHASNFNFEELLKRDINREVNVSTVDADTRSMWYKYLSITERLALELTENLRLVLEPTVASKLQGDYRSGKRLNIRKLIPYIASQFRKNKIWLRRTKKAKRDYQILLAIDDSSSMKDNMSMDLAFESLALLSTALRHLEVGRLGVCKFGDTPELLHTLDAQFMESSGASVMSQLKFEQKKTNVAALLEFVSSYFAQEASSGGSKSTDGLPAQLLLIVSDGRGIFAEGMERVKAAVQETLKMNIFTVFLILDSPAVKHSILDIKFFPPTTADGGPREIRPYLEYFPFPFYIILRQVGALPAVMGDALRQWFEVVVSQP